MFSVVRGEVHTEFSWGNLRESDHLEDVGVDWILILKWTLKNWNGIMQRIELTEDRDLCGR